MTRNVILDLVVPRRAEEQGAVHQGELLKHGQRSVAKCTVDHVPLARAEGRQDKPAKQGWKENQSETPLEADKWQHDSAVTELI